MSSLRNLTAKISILILASAILLPIEVLSQTKVVAPRNPYSIDKDVQVGQQAANEVERKMPLVRDSEVQYYVDRIGRKLAESIPAEFRHPQFRYSFKVVDARDINAFALPGGFTYVNRGLIEAAHNEGEMAGAIAHEISHVALRHGTAQAAKAQKYQAGAIAGQILGAVIGGGVGGVVAQGSQLGIGAYFLRFSREYEKQADLLGSQIMANAGYDPHDLANMFRTLEQQGRGGGPQWLSDHPNPGNRFDYINREADALRVNNPIRNTNEFNSIKAALRGMPRARTMQEIGRGGGQRSPGRGQGRQQPTGRIEYPSSRLRTYDGSFFRIAVPDNWRELAANDNVTFAPEGAYGETQGQFVFTHGIQVGITQNAANNLRSATDQLINGLAQGNPNLRKYGNYEREYLGRRDGLAISLTNVSEITGRQEIITVYTTAVQNSLFYVIAVAPQDEYQNYQRTFASIIRTLALN